MKHDAIVEQGIPIFERVPIPDELIPEDSRVEIDAKIHAGYCEQYSVLSISPRRFNRVAVSHNRQSLEYCGTVCSSRTSLGRR